MADWREVAEEQQRTRARYAAGHLGGLVGTEYGWEAGKHPEAEIKMEDFAPARQPERAGWLSFLRRRK